MPQHPVTAPRPRVLEPGPLKRPNKFGCRDARRAWHLDLDNDLLGVVFRDGFPLCPELF